MSDYRMDTSVDTLHSDGSTAAIGRVVDEVAACFGVSSKSFLSWRCTRLGLLGDCSADSHRESR